MRGALRIDHQGYCVGEPNSVTFSFFTIPETSEGGNSSSVVAKLNMAAKAERWKTRPMIGIFASATCASKFIISRERIAGGTFDHKKPCGICRCETWDMS